MYKVQKYVDESGLDHSLLELVKTRVSQMNGCAFCIEMHTKDARAADEIEQDYIRQLLRNLIELTRRIRQS